MAVVKWTFTDLSKPTPVTYTFEINPSEGGSPRVQKNIAISTTAGPNRTAVLQEGQSQPPMLSFSGTILTQTHYEAMEQWYDLRVLLELVDDLGRRFMGVLSSFDPQRQRRPYNPWYHKYTAEFTCFAYKQASGTPLYGILGYKTV